MAGWSPPGHGFDENGGALFLDHQITDRYGSWPGEPPETPTDALILPDAAE